MLYSSTILSLTALVGLSFAAPAPAADAIPDIATNIEARSAGFTIAQINTGNKKLKSGPIANRAAFLKFNKAVPPNVQQAAVAAATQQGSVAANPEAYDSEYLCPVQIGTPAVTLMLDFDTGSSDLWAFSTLQPTSQSAGHTLYNPSASNTSKLLTGETWNIGYQDGSGAKGVVYSDKVVIGSVTATSQAVEAATSVSSSFTSETNNDGLVGLAFDTINTASPSKVPTFYDNVRSSLTTPVFAAYLRKATAGTYDFGYIDSTKYTAPLTYVNVNSANGFWEFTATGYTVGTTKYTLSMDSIADTGTTLIYVPASAVKNYYAQVRGSQNNSGAGGYIFPCSATLPNFSVTIGGVSHTVPGSYINYAPYTSTYCFGGIQSSAGIGFNILGDIFLKSQYVVFDGTVPRIGFAQQK